MRTLLAVLAGALACGCSGGRTGVLITVTPGTDLAANAPTVDSVEVHLARAACGEFVQGGPGGGAPFLTPVGRDLAKTPYRLLVEADDPAGRIAIDVVAFAGGGAIARGTLVPEPFTKGTIDEYTLTLVAPLERGRYGAPGDEAAASGCYCHDGMVRMDSPAGDCFADVASDLPGSMCPAIAPLQLPFARCDGSLQGFETSPREVPCFVRDPNDPTVCMAGTRRCRDQLGIGYESGCVPLYPTQPGPCMAQETAGACVDPPWSWLPTVAPHSPDLPLALQGTSTGGVKLIACDGSLGIVDGSVVALPMGHDLPWGRVSLLDANGAQQVVVKASPGSQPMSNAGTIVLEMSVPPDGGQLVPIIVDGTYYVATLGAAICN